MNRLNLVADNYFMVTSTASSGSSNVESSVSMTTTSVSSLHNIVPACPQGLTINKNDFLKTDFSVDNFFIEVGVREGGTSLDVLRDDLGIYLKVLRSSMIELINQDYADFVNLSTNLVGLDKSIQQDLTEPLRAYRDQASASSIPYITRPYHVSFFGHTHMPQKYPQLLM